MRDNDESKLLHVTKPHFWLSPQAASTTVS
jgi:hypothetical protein